LDDEEAVVAEGNAGTRDGYIAEVLVIKEEESEEGESVVVVVVEMVL